MSKIVLRIFESMRWPRAPTTADVRDWRSSDIAESDRTRAARSSVGSGARIISFVSRRPHKPLRDDVRLLGGLLGETLRRQEGRAALRTGGARARAREAIPARRERRGHFETLAGELRAMPTEAAVPIARSFAHFLNLANIAEQHHRMRRRRAYQRDPHGRPQQGSDRGDVPPAHCRRRPARGAARGGARTAHRAGHHGASDRDHAPHPAAQVLANRRRCSPISIVRT